MTDHPDPELIFLKYETSDTEPRRLVRIKQLSLYERSPRPAEFYNNALVDPNGQLVVVSCYAGKLKFILLKNGNYHSDLDLSYVLRLSTIPRR
jgi:DNA damage-binding protein 1